MALPRSRSITFVFYLFFHLAISAVIERRSGLAEFEDAAPTPLAVLPAALPSSLLTPTTSVITATTDVATTSNGIVTTVPTTIISTSTGLVPIATITPPAASASPTGQASASKSASTSKTAAVVGGIVGAAIIVIGGILLCVYFRKRRRALTAQRLNSANEIRNPFDSESAIINPNRESTGPSIDRLQAREVRLTPSSTVSTRQLYISNEVTTVREKVAELEGMSTLLRTSSNENGTTQDVGADHATPRAAASLHDEPVNTSGDPLEVQAQLERAIRQIEVMNSRIRDLEMQRRSSWALGLSNEPPPGYSE